MGSGGKKREILKNRAGMRTTPSAHVRTELFYFWVFRLPSSISLFSQIPGALLCPSLRCRRSEIASFSLSELRSSQCKRPVKNLQFCRKFGFLGISTGNKNC